MSAAIGFQPASELPLSPSREEELLETIRRQAIIIERIEAGETKQQSSGGMMPLERQALVRLLSDLFKDVQDLKKALKEAQDDIKWIQGNIPKLIAEDRKRITDLEGGQDIRVSTTAKAHVDELYEHMKAIGRKQISFKEASRCLNLSKSRVQQFKVIIALDTRFIITKSESHKQKELIRLR